MGSIKTILSEYKVLAKKTILFIIIGIVLEVSIPLLVSLLIDHNQNNIVTCNVVVIMLLAAIAALVLGIQSAKNSVYLSVGVAKNIREQIYIKIQNFTFADLDYFTNASLLTRITTDVTSVQNSIQNAFSVLLRALFTLISTLIIALFINPIVGIMFFAVMIVAIVVVAIISKKALPYFGEGLYVYDQLNQSIQENISAARVVKAYVQEESEVQKFRIGSQKMYELFVKAEQVMVTTNPIMTFAMDTCLIIIAFAGSRWIVSGKMSTGEFISMFTYTANLMVALLTMVGAFSGLIMSLPSFNRIRELLDREILVAGELSKEEIADGSISVTDVNFKYKEDADHYDLKNINVEITSGETIGVIGSTGSGKSTFAQLILGLYKANTGRITIGGQDIGKINPDVLHKKIAMVLQKDVLFSGTIRENILWGNKNATDEEINNALQLACVYEFVKDLPNGLNTYVKQGGMNFSGGQRQRLCLARALIMQPQILILDDATSAVDTKTTKSIVDTLYKKFPNTTKIIIADRISSIQNCERILVFDRGTICGIGNHKELLGNNSIYKEIYISQQDGGDFDVR